VILEVEWDDVAHEAISVQRVADRLGEMVADCLDLMESRGSVADPSVFATIEKGGAK
jgi:hypothetical protein